MFFLTTPSFLEQRELAELAETYVLRRSWAVSPSVYFQLLTLITIVRAYSTKIPAVEMYELVQSSEEVTR